MADVPANQGGTGVTTPTPATTATSGSSSSSNPLSNLTNFIFNGAAPPSVTTYSSTTTGVPDWLAEGETNLLNTAAGVSQGLSQSGYPLAGLPQIGAFNPNYSSAQANVNSALGYSNPFEQQAWQLNANAGASDPLAAAQGDFNQAQSGYNAGLGANSLSMVQPYAQQAGSMSGIQQASPYLQAGAAYASNAAGSNPLSAASSLINQASTPLSSQINDLMQNSYIPQENDALAAQAATNLQKYLLPASDSQFISNGQAGSSRNEDYDALTTAYANQNLTAQQAANLQQGYQSAASTALGNQSNLAGLANTVGGLSNAGAQTQLGAASQLGALGSTFGNLTTAQQQQLLNSGALLGSTNSSDIAQQLSAAQGLTSQGQAAGALSNQGTQNALQAASQQAGLGQQVFNQQMSTGQAQDALGQEQQNYDTSAVQANNQNVLNTANWTPDQLSFLSNILHGLPSAGSTSTTTNQGPSSVYSPSPASQIAGLATLAKYT